MTENEFFNALIDINVSLNENQKEQILKYLNLVEETNKVMDLTANTSKEEILEKNFYDSILAFSDFDYDNKTLIDVGSGAGFPGMLFAICKPLLHVVLLEPMKKRCEFLTRVKENLHLNNVEVICARSEDYALTHKEKFDFATSRGVAKLNVLFELIIPLLTINGIFIALKGKNALLEEEDAKNAIKELNVKRIDVKHLFLPTNKENRINLYYIKEKKTNNKYPRKYALIKKKPL